MLSYQGLGAGGGVGAWAGGGYLWRLELYWNCWEEIADTQSDWRETVYQVHGARRSQRAERRYGRVARLVKEADIVSIVSQSEISLFNDLLKHLGFYERIIIKTSANNLGLKLSDEVSLINMSSCWLLIYLCINVF